jgi:hypothetical protein
MYNEGEYMHQLYDLGLITPTHVFKINYVPNEYIHMGENTINQNKIPKMPFTLQWHIQP